MIRVSNRKTIANLSRKSLKAGHARNCVAVTAIALTTLLFTALFTIALSINDSFQQNSFREAGGWCHGTFKYLDEAEADALCGDPLIKQYGLRRFVGMPEDVPFNKDHVEVGWSDANQAHFMFCDPVEGRLPQEGTDEAAADERVLSLLGIEPKLGARFTLPFTVDGVETTQTFTLCGWWAHDKASPASHVLIPASRADAIFDETGLGNSIGRDGTTGSLSMDVLFASSLHIERDMETVLERHGYQSTDSAADNYIPAGVNWSYSGAQLAVRLDPATAAAIAALLVLITVTGYLIISNVFRISVAGDIRFYGMLKTIGTTPRQLRGILHRQALALCLPGITLGLVLGWLSGAALTPVVAKRLNGLTPGVVSFRPWIFLFAALFALGTVLLSCRRPARMAGRVSPIEALHYTEGGRPGKKATRRTSPVTPFSMALASLGRSRSKTLLTVLSMALAVVLLNMTVTFTNGFDEEKYLDHFASSDFVLADAQHFQTGRELFNPDQAVPQSVLDFIAAQGGITAGGRVYGKTSYIQEFVTPEHYRALMGQWLKGEDLDRVVANAERNNAGQVITSAQLSGMDAYGIDRLTLLDGDLSQLKQPGSRAIAAVYHLDEYDRPEPGSNWAQLGDTVLLRYVEAFRYIDPATGRDADPACENYVMQLDAWRDVEYTVTALVAVPNSLDYAYSGDDTFVLNDQTFIADTGTADVMLYAFDADAAAEADLEQALKSYTETTAPQLDYASRATVRAEFTDFKNMFLLLGSVLSLIIGLVGVLNFFNAVLTGILARRRELAMLQSVGMTGRQVKAMLVWEGVGCGAGAIALSLLLSALLGPVMAHALGSVIWFFTYRFTVLPVLCMLPVFALLGTLLPLLCYRSIAKQTIVERLREAE